MAAEDVVTDMPLLSDPVLHSESEPGSKIPISTPLLPTPAEASGGRGHGAQADHFADDLREDGPSILIELRTAELPRLRPRIIVDQRRISRDDD
jgi:hypothetical protein